jgi:type VI secretion system secreted protein VgrG
MNVQLSQADRVAQLSTPLGDDVLVLTRFSASEGLGDLFTFDIEAISEQANIDFDPAIGQNCQVKLKTYDDKVRIFNGMMVHARWTGSATGGVMGDIYSYHIVLRPWFWLLGHRADCRIFLEMNVKDIITQVFTTAGFTDYDDRTTGDYDTIEYCVQYRETDLAFCSRLMELYGIYYFFEHTDGKHTLVLADSRSSHKVIADLPELPLIPLANRSMREMQARPRLDFGAPVPHRQGPIQRLRLHPAEQDPAGAQGGVGELRPFQARSLRLSGQIRR